MRGFLVAAAVLLACSSRAVALANPELDALESRVSFLESFAKGPGVCLSSASESGVRADLSGPELSDSAKGVLLTAVLPPLERLYNARAFQAGGPAVCDELSPLRATVKREKIAGDLAFDLLCKTNYYEALMAKATILNQPTMFDLCLVRNRVGDRDFKLDSLDVSCRIIAERKGTVDEVCGRLNPYYDNASIAQTCPRMLRYVSGDETVCKLFSDRMVHERCMGYVAFKKEAAGDKAACGKEPHCRLMNGDAAGVAAIGAKDVVVAACGVYGRTEIVKERARRLYDEASRLQGRIYTKDLTVSIAGAFSRQEISELLERENANTQFAKEQDDELERAIRLEVRTARLAGIK